MLLEKGEVLNFSSEELEFVFRGIPKNYLNEISFMKHLYPIVLQSFLLIENNTYKYMAIRIKCNKLDCYSATPNNLILPPKAKSIIKFQYYLTNINENTKNHKFRFETIRFKDFDYDINQNSLSTSELDDLFNNFHLGINKSNNDNYCLNLLMSSLNESSFQSFEKTCKLDFIFSKDDLNDVPVGFHKNENTTLFSDNETLKYKTNISKDKKDIKDNKILLSKKTINLQNKIESDNTSISIKSLSEDLNNKEVLPKNLKKELNYLNEKLSNIKFECSRLEEQVNKEKYENKENFRMLSKCKFLF